MDNNSDIFDSAYAPKSKTTIKEDISEKETKAEDNNSDIFDSAYAPKSKTTIKEDISEKETKAEFKIEEEKYGISKPFRVIIKAKTLHGED